MYGFIGNIGPWELVFILLVALIVVGPGKLPEVARSLGKAASEFRKTTSGVRREFQDALKFDEEPQTSASDSKTTKTSIDDTVDISDIENETKSENEEEHNPYQ